MCGIGGTIRSPSAPPIDRSSLTRIRDGLLHRGPDDSGIWSDERCGLCHTRLAVLDPSPRGRNPMADREERYWIVYNGEIYNFRELRDELVERGSRFTTGTDTEVLLELFRMEGPAGIHRLEGMFAFALFDRVDGVLHLVRDRLGIKPLFYSENEEGLSFASEPKALPRSDGRSSPSPARIAEYLAFRNLAGSESLEPDVHTLPPGHRLETDGRASRVVRWNHARDAGSGEDIGDVLAGAVRRQLVSDVPVGVFLSGGCDSALVCASAAAELPGLDAFTVSFDDPNFDETRRAAHVVAEIGPRWHKVRVPQSDYVDLLETVTWYLDSPLNHAHTPHLLLLSREARKHITVALTGEGADEIFAGYPRYRLHAIARGLAKLPLPAPRWWSRRLRSVAPRVARLLFEAGADEATSAASNAAFVPLGDSARLAGLDDADLDAILHVRLEMYREARDAGKDPMESLLELEKRTYLVSLLQRMDRMSMATGLECRVPLLDETLVARARGMSVRERLDVFETKKPIRALAAARFGKGFAHAPKSGFGVPVGAWFRGGGPLADRLAVMLGDGVTRDRGWIDVDLADHWFSEHRDGVRDRSEALWGVLNLELWARVCLDASARPGKTITEAITA